MASNTVTPIPSTIVGDAARRSFVALEGHAEIDALAAAVMKLFPASEVDPTQHVTLRGIIARLRQVNEALCNSSQGDITDDALAAIVLEGEAPRH